MSRRVFPIADRELRFSNMRHSQLGSPELWFTELRCPGRARTRPSEMDLGLTDKRAAVAASSAGLGLATARALLDEGALVAICGRDADRLSVAAASLGGDAIAIEADVATTDGATRFVEMASERLGGLDILVANAGGPPPGAATGTSLEAYRSAIEMNLLSAIAMCQAVVPGMRDQGWGRILAITSIGAREPIPFLAASTTRARD